MENAYDNIGSGGWFTLQDLDVHAMEDWYLYQFFPSARALDWEDFLRTEALLDLLAGVGFRVASCEVHRDTQRITVAEAYRVCERRHGTSQLTGIENAAYEEGLARLAERCRREGEAVLESPVAVLDAVVTKP